MDIITKDVKKGDCSSKRKTKFEKSELEEIFYSLTKKEKFRLWIKTLLSSSRVFPEIIKTIDKIIELQATTVSFMSVYDANGSTISQAEQIIDMSERKNSILNIYLMTKQIFKEASKDDQVFLVKKFIDKYTIDELAADYDVSPRTIYRRVEKLIDEICKRCSLKNFSLEFIESQIKDEKWLTNNFKKIAYEYIKSSGQNRK